MRLGHNSRLKPRGGRISRRDATRNDHCSIGLVVPTAGQVIVQFLRVRASTFAEALDFGTSSRKTQGNYSLGDDRRSDGAEADEGERGPHSGR